MNLKTHTAYPETMINGDTFAWVSKILAGNGEVMDTKSGKADSYDAARTAAVAWVYSVVDSYVKPAEEETA